MAIPILSKQHLILAGILIIASLVTVQAAGLMAPQTFAPQAAPQANANQMSTFSINATGQATPIPKGNTVGATLMLTGTMSTNNGGQIQFSDINGTLQIGSLNYSIVSGHGVQNNKGMVQINAKTSDGQELILHGKIQGNTVTFTKPESKLASKYFLDLQGQITITPIIVTSSTSVSSSSNSTVTSPTNSTVTTPTNSTTTVVTNSTTTTATNSTSTP